MRGIMRMRVRLILSCAVICAVMLATGTVRAQQTESLRIGPGDVIQIQVFDTPSLSGSARVTDSGEVILVLGAKVKVAGLTSDQAARVIEKTFLADQILRQPHVVVSISEFATQRVSVLGEVNHPGALSIGTSRPILDVLALAGGLTPLADRRILIQRHDSSERVSYFLSNQPSTALDTSVMVYPGDTILVPLAGIVYALGDVRIPGGYTMTNTEGQLTVLELIARCGGTNHTAVPSHARLIRKTNSGYVEFPLPLSAMQKGKRSDMLLQADDIVYVPFSYMRNFAIGSASIVGSVGSAAVYRY
jgi:polysaccharide biosynthesis/export protein